MLAFLDANIILDYIDSKRRVLYPESVKLFSLVERENVKFCTSALVFSNIAYILRKLDHKELMHIFADLRTIIDVLPTNSKVLDMAITSDFTDFEDAIQFYTAKNGGADLIVTRNVEDFIDSSLPVMLPSEFFSQLK